MIFVILFRVQGDCYNSVTLYFIHFVRHLAEKFRKCGVGNSNPKRKIFFLKAAAFLIYRERIFKFFKLFANTVDKNRLSYYNIDMIEVHFVKSIRFIGAFLPERKAEKGAGAEVGVWQSAELAYGNNIPLAVAEMRRAIRSLAYISVDFIFRNCALIFRDGCCAAVFFVFVF